MTYGPSSFDLGMSGEGGVEDDFADERVEEFGRYDGLGIAGHASPMGSAESGFERTKSLAMYVRQ